MCRSIVWPLGVLLLWGTLLPTTIHAQGDYDEDNIDEGEELLLFEDIPVVVSSSRQSTPINLSPVPISIVSGTTIHLSGISRVEQIFDFVPGMDSIRFDKNRYGFGIRGFTAGIGDRTLGLLDGRPVTTVLWGVPDYQRVPLIMEDIERIEVVRGPSGGAWGANAFQGVVNVITKKLQDTTGALASVTINEYGDHYSQFRFGAASDGWGYRLSGSYEHAESSDEDLTGIVPGLIGASFGESRDFTRALQTELRAQRVFSDENQFDLGLGYSYQRIGPYEVLGIAPSGSSDDYVRAVRGHAKISRSTGPESSWYVQYFGQLDTIDRSAWSLWTLDNTLELQADWSPTPDHQATVGAVGALTLYDSDRGSVSDLAIQGGVQREDWVGIFGVDRWHASDRITVEGQLRGDYYSETGADWSGRLTGLYALDAEHDHVLRLSGARSFRAPRAGYREISGSFFPLPSPIGGFAFSIAPAQDIENERVWAVEAGTNSTWAAGLSTRVDVYWQRYERLIGVDLIFDGFGRQTSVADNNGQAHGYGFEAEVTYACELADLSMWYALNAFDHDDAQESIRAKLPARQKYGATLNVHLPWELELWTGVKHATLTKGDPSRGTSISGYTRLDLTLSRRFLEDRAEILLGVRDLLNETDMAVDDVTSFSSQENDGRIYFVRGEIKF